MPDTHQEIWLMTITASFTLILLVLLVIYFTLHFQDKKIQHRKQLIEFEKKFKEELLQTKLEIQEQSFQTISQEIHDNIGQALSLVKLNVSTIEVEKQDDARSKLADSKQLLGKIIQDIRDLSRTLNTDLILQIGLVSAIELQLRALEKTGVFTTEFVVSEQVQRYESQVELVLFRVIQELLNNIIKHSQGTFVRIALDYLQNKLIITVHDNGKGFDTAMINHAESKTGQGLRNISNRIALLKGHIAFDSQAGMGTTVTIALG